MPHEVHESRQRDSGPHHVGSERMTKPMGIGLWNLAPFSVMAKQRAETGGRHRLSPVAALERDEQRGRVRQGSLQVKVPLQGRDGVRRQRQDSFLIALALDADLSFRQA